MWSPKRLIIIFIIIILYLLLLLFYIFWKYQGKIREFENSWKYQGKVREFEYCIKISGENQGIYFFELIKPQMNEKSQISI